MLLCSADVTVLQRATARADQERAPGPDVRSPGVRTLTCICLGPVLPCGVGRRERHPHPLPITGASYKRLTVLVCHLLRDRMRRMDHMCVSKCSIHLIELA